MGIVNKWPILILCLFLFSCGDNKCSIKAEKFNLQQPYSQKLNFEHCQLDQVYYHYIQITGEFYGEAYVGGYFHLVGNGKIDTLITADSYSDKYRFNYEPVGEVSGELEFEVWLR